TCGTCSRWIGARFRAQCLPPAPGSGNRAPLTERSMAARQRGGTNRGKFMARTRQPLIAGNWKMNGFKADALALAKGVAEGVKQAGWTDRQLLVCPPATLVMVIADALMGSGVLVGGQDCHPRPSGAHTGDIAAEMLRDCGASHVIVGHSERRADHGETDATVRAKAQAAWRAGLVAVICI